MVPPAPANLLVRLAGVDTREQAAAPTNAELWVPRASLPALIPGEVYVEDPVGCTVIDVAGRLRGTVRGHLLERRPGHADRRRAADGGVYGPRGRRFIREVDLPRDEWVVDGLDER